MAAFDINTKTHIELTTFLGRLHKSALPLAVRGTLNAVAFETRENIPETASRKFTTRSKTFFKAFSSVDKAKGFDINSMVATVGINPSKGSKVAEGLEKQETGGAIQGRKLIPHDKGRVSGSHSKRLRRKNRFGNIKIADSRKKGQGSINYLLIKKGSKGTVFEIKGTGRRRKLTPVYTYRSSKTSRVQSSPFMKPASIMATKLMHSFYIKEAAKRVEFERKKGRL